MAGAALLHFGGAVSDTLVKIRAGRPWVGQRSGPRDRPIPFEHLSLARQEYVTWRARGYSPARSAEQAGVALQTATGWEKMPWFQQALRQRRERIEDDKVQALIRALPAALDSLVATLEGEPPNALRLDAAKYVIDHVYGKATVRSESHTRTEIATVSPDDVLRALDRLNGLGVAIDADYQTVEEGTP